METATILSGETITINFSTDSIYPVNYTWTATQSGTVTGATAGTGNSISQELNGEGTVIYNIIATETATGCSGPIKQVIITVNPIVLGTATINWTHTKDINPHVESFISINEGASNAVLNYGNSSGSFGTIEGTVISAFNIHSFPTIKNPIPSTARMLITKTINAVTTTIFDSGNVNATVSDTLSNFSFTAEANAVYQITTTTNSDATNYLASILEQVNNSSVANTGLLITEIYDDTNTLFVIKNGNFEQSSTVGFNYLNDANTATIIVKNTSTTSINVVVTNTHIGASYTNNFTLAAGAQQIITGLVKTSYKTTFS